MRCRRARRLVTRLAARGEGAGPELTHHLASCAGCQRFADRWAAVRRGIEGRLTLVTPDSGFASRVTARLDRAPDPFVWAARRLLPATLALTLVLGGWCLLRTPGPASVAEQLTDADLLTWVASGDEERR